MKNGKNPTRKQKALIKEMGLNPENWLVSKSLHNQLLLIHRWTGAKRTLQA
ncbi:hypothetical protein WD019_02985 [Fictibacillus sp. Mic-4]|uniref:DUF6906 family protein n=1 Tax=Fictibacillus sp. Mic-4 TaxID=3132826 RepID=UPI003CF33222